MNNTKALFQARSARMTGLIYRIRYRAYSLPKKEFQGMDLALRSTLQREEYLKSNAREWDSSE
ncbi:hypothetical protein N7492_007787 [Penicillium capsulatum]|uniref:Uncharacterized protein n=1 Tax=Penicillium capsulatum TaxID=69766 RepID=A0A9W9LLM2_9EURO|nr:hypothetical protein N7492_007787 [Penicillium capsulatum]